MFRNGALLEISSGGYKSQASRCLWTGAPLKVLLSPISSMGEAVLRIVCAFATTDRQAATYMASKASKVSGLAETIRENDMFLRLESQS